MKEQYDEERPSDFKAWSGIIKNIIPILVSAYSLYQNNECSDECGARNLPGGTYLDGAIENLRSLAQTMDEQKCTCPTNYAGGSADPDQKGKAAVDPVPRGCKKCVCRKAKENNDNGGQKSDPARNKRSKSTGDVDRVTSQPLGEESAAPESTKEPVTFTTIETQKSRTAIACTCIQTDSALCEECQEYLSYLQNTVGCLKQKLAMAYKATIRNSMLTNTNFQPVFYSTHVDNNEAPKKPFKDEFPAEKKSSLPSKDTKGAIPEKMKGETNIENKAAYSREIKTEPESVKQTFKDCEPCLEAQGKSKTAIREKLNSVEDKRQKKAGEKQNGIEKNRDYKEVQAGKIKSDPKIDNSNNCQPTCTNPKKDCESCKARDKYQTINKCSDLTKIIYSCPNDTKDCECVYSNKNVNINQTPYVTKSKIKCQDDCPNIDADCEPCEEPPMVKKEYKPKTTANSALYSPNSTQNKPAGRANKLVDDDDNTHKLYASLRRMQNIVGQNSYKDTKLCRPCRAIKNQDVCAVKRCKALDKKNSQYNANNGETFFLPTNRNEDAEKEFNFTNPNFDKCKSEYGDETNYQNIDPNVLEEYQQCADYYQSRQKNGAPSSYNNNAYDNKQYMLNNAYQTGTETVDVSTQDRCKICQSCLNQYYGEQQRGENADQVTVAQTPSQICYSYDMPSFHRRTFKTIKLQEFTYPDHRKIIRTEIQSTPTYSYPPQYVGNKTLTTVPFTGDPQLYSARPRTAPTTKNDYASCEPCVSNLQDTNRPQVKRTPARAFAYPPNTTTSTAYGMQAIKQTQAQIRKVVNATINSMGRR